MENSTGKFIWGIGAQLALIGFLMLVIFALVWAASKGWKRGQAESSYCVDGNKDCYKY